MAEAVGVSHAAVSYAYNRPDKLSQQQRSRILAVAAELGYPGPNPTGRSLRTGKVGALGLILTDSLPYAFEDPGVALLMRGIAEVGELAQVALTLLPAPLEAVPAAASLDALLRGVVDGFMVYAMPDRHPVLDSVLRRRLPVVTIDGPALEGHSRVGIDDRGAAREAARHLLALGHRDVAVLVSRLSPDGRSGPASHSRIAHARDRVMKARVKGYRDAFAEAGVGVLPVVEAGGFSAAQSRAGAEMLLDTRSVTAVLAATDVLALALLDAAAGRGLRVPEDLAVIGFDDLPAAAVAGLTTVRQPMTQKGQEAARLLLNTINGTPGTHLVTLPTELVVRGSTGEPTTGSTASPH
ncbi:LacI family DNA-binding transcriptional regulator [Amycolatopsis sp. NPDC059021]|uniref:LacI family DNA-binding transcriptional regulator n=1 Tax=Amycolatopsis sp. NPDC059021 TaxID=3346704 RepID=UPI00366EE1A6